MHFLRPGGIDIAGIAKASTDMGWVRSNVRSGSWCALFALAIQLVLSFGHVHRAEFLGSSDSSQLAALRTSVASETASHVSSTPAKPIGLAFDYCAICAVIVLANSVRPETAPPLPTPAVVPRERVEKDAEIVPAALPHLLFQARAPPLA